MQNGRSAPEWITIRSGMRVKRTYFILPVSEMGPVADFYERVFGLRAEQRSEEWTEIPLADGVAVALQRGPALEQEIGLGFEVDDVVATCRLATASGGFVVATLEPGTRGRSRRAIVLDPAGNRISVATRLRPAATAHSNDGKPAGVPWWAEMT
jgi:predicted enzyme related to lactoylglutathione lyase